MKGEIVMDEKIVYINQYCECGNEITDSTYHFKLDDYGEVIECDNCKSK